jgi:energy-coupling factor transport system permease protein
MSRTSHTGSDYACQYRPGNSAVHRLPSSVKVVITVSLCVVALAGREPLPVALATGLCLAYYFLAGLNLNDLWRDARFFLLQAAILLTLYVHRHGLSEGLWLGTRTSLQILLFFIPGIVFIRTTQASSMMKGLRRWLPHRILFLFFTSLRFVPFFARELGDIVMAQKLRGARLSAKSFLWPGAWGDAFFCVVIPLMVRALKTADEAARSAQARGMGRTAERSYYDEQSLKRYMAQNSTGAARDTQKEVPVAAVVDGNYKRKAEQQ